MQVGDEITYLQNEETLRGYIAEQNKDKTWLLRFYHSEKTLDIEETDKNITVLEPETLQGFSAITLTDERGENPFASIRLETQKFEVLEQAAQKKGISMEKFMLEVLHEYLDAELEKIDVPIDL